MTVKLKINKFKDILNKPKVGQFLRRTFDDTIMELSIHEDSTGKYFIIHANFQVYGWTTDAFKAFHFWNNIIPIHTCNEIYELARGRAI